MKGARRLCLNAQAGAGPGDDVRVRVRARVPARVPARIPSKLASLAMAAITSVVLPPSLAPAHAAPPPGQYLTEGGWGRLTLTDRDGTRWMSLRTSGPNGHGCGLDGPVDAAGLAHVPPDPGAPTCTVRLRDTGRGGELEVTPLDEGACRGYCGARAGGFDGLYRRAVPGCTLPERQRARQAFQRHYEAREYEPATAALGPVLARCAAVLPALEAAWIRNDLALAHARAGRREACAQLLLPLREAAAQTEAQVREQWPPADAQSWLRVLRATRTNLALCDR